LLHWRSSWLLQRPPKLILFGIVMGADDARIGDDIGGWKVTQIEERQLALSPRHQQPA
jgi:hypothetical protein